MCRGGWQAWLVQRLSTATVDISHLVRTVPHQRVICFDRTKKVSKDYIVSWSRFLFRFLCFVLFHLWHSHGSWQVAFFFSHRSDHASGLNVVTDREYRMKLLKRIAEAIRQWGHDRNQAFIQHTTMDGSANTHPEQTSNSYFFSLNVLQS